MNRRTFIASLIAGATLDPERLLWVPGKKKVFIPPPQPLPELVNYQRVCMRGLGIVSPSWYLVTMINGQIEQYERAGPPYCVPNFS